MRAISEGVRAIGLIDGYFEQVPAVWHREILLALAENIPVFGAASMGALRAAELSPFGMQGVGRIFEDFRSGALEDDDEVAVQHGPPETKYLSLSDAMVNIRATVAAAHRAGVIESHISDRFLQLAKARFYKQRSFGQLLEDAGDVELDQQQVRSFARWLEAGKVDQKRIDAMAMLKAMADDQASGYPVKPAQTLHFEAPASWQQPRAIVADLNRRDVPQWHFAMLNDHRRVEAFRKAINTAVCPGDVVLDVGTGTGLLAILAARAGAQHVYACERVERIAAKAREIIATNGLADRIEVLGKSSLDLAIGDSLPQRADVLMTETVDRVLIGEGIVSLAHHAALHLLKSGARIVPRAGRLLVAAFECEALYRNHCVDVVAGVDVRAFNAFSAGGVSQPLHLAAFRLNRLSDPVELFGVTFGVSDVTLYRGEIEIETTRSGTVHGIVAWFELEVDADNSLDNSPWGEGSHWMNEVCFIERAREAAPGDRFRVTYRISESGSSLCLVD